ncbi:MAG: hypothetical protein GWN01_10330 [Nitrosopumilaceae archaeon]|nr:hypothetical protein [Nitrosopumilaceae archaeon]NIU01295.1 hypothetical protein [Nitrosopumilaceae archaeon]NIU87643.1 hypothetical protein [Nitrosopumilaceae archaeon]NIV66068.1 hypothetical protein [Nitrosopumilaceae archaeon]NIX61897.1 hypothetical protein [Nitrosopumilaceae archaeon]
MQFAEAEISFHVKNEYEKGDRVTIYGKVPPEYSKSPVTMQVIQDRTFLRTDVLIPKSDGTFSNSFETKGPLWLENEIYEVRVVSGVLESRQSFKVISKEEELQNDKVELLQVDTLQETEERNQQDVRNNDKTKIVELVKNGNFEAGLQHWRAKPNEIDCKQGAFWIEECTEQKERKYGFPKSTVTDKLTPGERYFVTFVPSYSEEGIFDWTFTAVTASVLEQDVDIPQSDKVTLSFKARGYSDTMLEIFVKDRDSGTKTQVNQVIVNDKPYEFGDFIYRSYDMTNFAGKKITLMFVSKEISVPSVGYEDLKTAVYLDDISLIAQVPAVLATESENDENLWLVIFVPLIVGLVVATSFVFRRKRTTTPKEETLGPIFASKNDSTLQTRGKVPKDLVPEEPTLEKTITEETNETETKEETIPYQEDSTYTDKDYQFGISLSKPMICLWLLYKEPSHSFTNKNQLIKAAAEIEKTKTISNRKPYYDSIKLLEKKGMVELEKIQYDSGEHYKETGKVLLTKKGLDLIQKARKDKVTSWNQFIEKYFTKS